MRILRAGDSVIQDVSFGPTGELAVVRSGDRPDNASPC
jgi:hypothetical protein